MSQVVDGDSPAASSDSRSSDESPDPSAATDPSAPSAEAVAQAEAGGAEPDESGLILLDQPLAEFDMDGESYTVDGVINPALATPLYENERLEGLVSLTPLVEELTGIPWPERREEILRDHESETACGGADQHIWLSFDTAENPTCFEESGGVIEPYFRSISAICQSAAAVQSRALYMGLGGEHSFETSLGNSTGWDLMYRSPRISEPGSCYTFTVPVRGAVASFGNSPG